MDKIYTVRIADWLCIPEGDGHLTLAQAKEASANLIAEGHRGVYIMNHVTGEKV